MHNASSGCRGGAGPFGAGSRVRGPAAQRGSARRRSGHPRRLTLRLTGGIAVRYYALDRRFADRAHTDIDLVGLKRESGALVALLDSLGYWKTARSRSPPRTASCASTHAPAMRRHSVERRAVGAGVRSYDHIDVFLDAMDMDHTLPMRDRLKLDRYAISPADLLLSKLQVAGSRRRTLTT